MNEDDWKTIHEWMLYHYGRQFPADFFPKTGVAAYVNGIPGCIIPVYLESTSSVAVLGHCAVNEGLEKKVILSAVEKCIRGCVEFSRKNGKKYAVTIFGRNSINRIADKCGFFTADTIEEKFCLIGGGE